jgi:uncharacterized protein YndB with AHSA1/START domain
MEQPETESADVELEMVVAASPDVVFAHFTDPERMLRWKGIAAELDPRPGGIYRVDMNGRDVARGEYVEVVPYSRVVFSWGWEGPDHPLPPGSSTVEVTLQPFEGGTIVRLRHTGLSEAMRGPHRQGWEHFLPRLRTTAEGGDPGPDPLAQPQGG